MSKEKKEKKGRKSPVGAASAGPLKVATSELASYEDGAPLDKITYLEAKLILKPDRFTSVQCFRDFGKIVRATAKKVGVGFIPDPNSERRPEVREIIFGDTPDFRLYNNAFILRRRITYVDGFPVGDPEIVFKYRHPDEQKATQVDVRPRIDGKYRIKFKAEALPLKDRIGGYRILYSHNCQFGLSQVHEADKSLMATLNATNMAVLVGEKLSGIMGSVAAVAGMCLPGAALMYAVGIFYHLHGDHPWATAALKGVAAAAVGLILSTVVSLSKKALSRKFDFVFMAATVLAVNRLHWSVPRALIVVGILAILFHHPGSAEKVSPLQ